MQLEDKGADYRVIVICYLVRKIVFQAYLGKPVIPNETSNKSEAMRVQNIDTNLGDHLTNRLNSMSDQYD